MLTNFQTIRKSIRRLETIQRQEADGTLAQLKKKERLMRRREREKLERVLGGIADMNRLPGAIFVVDIRREHIAVSEARKLNIPVIALIDTNCDPDLVDFPVPANDDAMKSVALFTRVIADAIGEGAKAGEIEREAAKVEAETRKAEAAEIAAEAKGEAGATPAPTEVVSGKRPRAKGAATMEDMTVAVTPPPAADAAASEEVTAAPTRATEEAPATEETPEQTEA
jgi:small subunit ribosomal protein S2